MIYWFTGQPGSGKTTLADRLLQRGLVDQVVDGDHLRSLANPGYDEDGRRQNIDRAQAIAAFLSSMGADVAVALVSPYRDQREAFAERHDVVTVYLEHDTDVRPDRMAFRVDDYQPPQVGGPEHALRLVTTMPDAEVDVCVDLIVAHPHGRKQTDESA